MTASRVPAALVVMIALAACRRGGTDAPAEDDEHASQGAKGAAPFHVDHSASGETTVVLAPESLAAAGIVTALVTPREVADESAAFGVLVADPSRVGVLRAPLAGTVTAGGERGGWPAVGASIEAGAIVGQLAPRIAPLTPVERADLESKLASARADELATQAELDAARLALDRAQKLNGLDKGVSDQALETIAATVKGSEAKLAAAREGRSIFEALASATAPSSLAPLALRSPRAGEVVAVLAQPGESVEAGQELARIADFSELFADVRLPLEAGAASSPTHARIVAGGASFDATIVGPAPESDPLAPRLRLRVRDPASTLRPGLGVTAWLAHAGAPRPAFAIPASAALRYAGRSWVYVESGSGRFTRRAIAIVRSDGDALLVGEASGGVGGGEGVGATTKVVTVGAMLLLSQEQLASGGGGEE